MHPNITPRFIAQCLKKRFLVCVLLCSVEFWGIPSGVFAQRFTFRRIGTEQGLSQCTVLSMLQDHYGFMWLCTQDGLNRYDGYTFKTYKHNAEDSTSLSSSMAISIVEDRSGTIWVGTYNGLNRLNRATGKFRRFYPDSLRIPQRCSIWSISEIPDGRLVVATSNGLFQFDAVQECLREFVSTGSSAQVFKGKACHRIVDNTGRYVFRVERRLYEYRPETNTFAALDFTPKNIDPRRNMLMPIFIDKQGGYWSISEARANPSLLGLYRFMPPGTAQNAADGGMVSQGKNKATSEQWTRFQPGEMNIQSMVDMVGRIFQDSQNHIWVQTLSGLNLFDPVHNTFKLFQHSPADPLSLGANRIVSMYEDRSGLLWVASNGSGVNIMLPQKFLLYRLSDPPSLQRRGRFHFLKGITEDRDGALWIAEYDHGLRKFDRTTGEFTEYKDTKSVLKGGIASLLCLHADKDGLIWFGGSFNHLGCFNPATRTFFYYGSKGNMPPADDALWINYMRFLTEDEHGFLWLATDRNGLQVFSKRQKRYVAHFLGNHDVSSVFVARSSSRTVYAGTDGAGIYTFSPIPNLYDSSGLPHFRIKHFRHNPNDSTTLSAHNTIKYFYEDSKGYIWIGMDGGGLNRFDPRTETFVRYSERNGLPNNVVYGILPDSHHNLWLSTNKGLSKFNPENHTFRNYDVSDGLQGNEFNSNSFASLRTGELLFGGIGGINIFHPDSVRDNTHPPPVMITDILINDHAKQFDKPVEDLRELTLRYDENTLSFTFAGLDYMNSTKNQYMYKLEGVTNVIDKDWVQSGTGRTVRYAALPQGEYVFRVKACNNDGVWNEQGVALKINLVPPFWREAWFYALCMLVGLSAGVGVVRAVVRRRLMQRIERLEHERALERARLGRELAIERERGRIAQDIHDEVGPGITKILLLSGYADTVALNGVTGEPVHTTDGHIPAPLRNPLSQAAQEVIDGMNGIIWMTNPQNDTLDNLMAYIREYAAEYLSQASIACRFDIPDTVPPVHLYGTLRRNIFLTVKEALNNIVKHAHASETTIALIFQHDQKNGSVSQQEPDDNSAYRFQLRISDNGKGVNDADVSRFGNGLDNMRRRMEECNCQFTVLTHDGRGTVITLDIVIFPTPYLNMEQP